MASPPPPPGSGRPGPSPPRSSSAAPVRDVAGRPRARCRPVPALGLAQEPFEVFLAIEPVAVHRMAAGPQLAGAVPVAQGRRGGPEVGRRLLDGQVAVELSRHSPLSRPDKPCERSYRFV